MTTNDCETRLSTLDPSTASGVRLSTLDPRSSTAIGGFTLIEMLVVIGVIGILAAMVIALAPLASRVRVDARAKSELNQLVSAIEAYKAKKGFYPPSNPADETKPPLYYELKGTRIEGNDYVTLDGASRIPQNQIQGNYGVAGFVNSTTTEAAGAGDPDRPSAEDFHTGLKISQTSGTTNALVYLGIPHVGPDSDAAPGKPPFERWRYHLGEGNTPISNRPKRNKEGYDLWIELKVGGKTKTYGNWKE